MKTKQTDKACTKYYEDYRNKAGICAGIATLLTIYQYTYYGIVIAVIGFGTTLFAIYRTYESEKYRRLFHKGDCSQCVYSITSKKGERIWCDLVN